LRELQSIDFQAIAQAALAEILVVEGESQNGEIRTVETVISEARVFLNNDMVRNDLALMADLSRRFHEFCAGHGVDPSKALQDPSAIGVFSEDSRGHNHDHTKDDDACVSGRCGTCKSCKKKK